MRRFGAPARGVRLDQRRFHPHQGLSHDFYRIIVYTGGHQAGHIGPLVVDLGYSGNLARRMRRADRIGVRAAVLLGDDELAKGIATLRNLDSGAQSEVALDALPGHLKALYGGAPFDFFIYDSAKLGQVRNYATSPQIQIMVMTVGAINKFGDEQQAQAEESDEAARRATLLMYAAEGAVILARAQRSIEPLVFTAEQLSTRPGE